MKKPSSLIAKHLSQKILVLDGAMGTALQDENLCAQDFGGDSLEGCNENLVLTRPKIIEKIHESHLLAGCDIIETNTFGGTPIVLDEYQISDKAEEINYQAAQIAKKVAIKHSTSKKPRFVAGSVGPTTKAITVTGGVTFSELVETFYIQMKALLDGGVDYFLIETCQDSRNIKAALNATDKLFNEKQKQIPIAISGTIEPTGTLLAGQSAEAFLTSFSHKNLLYLGLNCATGPAFMTDHIRSMAEISSFPIACVPNAGLPDEEGNYLETPEMIAGVLERFLQKGWLNLMGGCCGTHSGHIKALSELAAKYSPRAMKHPKKSFLSGVDFLEVTEDNRPVIVGERTNVIGSRKFKRLICEGKLDEASDLGRSQVKHGAQIIDICLANPDREELDDMKDFLECAIKKVRAPLMIDSTDEKVIELALTYSQGKSIINSINLEDGEERFEKVIPMANKYGAALVVGTIDDDPKQGMGVTRQRKLEIAERSYKLLTEKYDVKEEDIYWDPLVFPCATGDEQYVGSALETIEGIKLIKKKYPYTKTVLGISNVSFGLPPAGREVLNSVFLYHCVQAGLDLAIVNSQSMQRFSQIPQEQIKLAEDLLFNKGKDPIADFANFFREQKIKKKETKEKLPLNLRLSNYILEGEKTGLIEDLDEALKKLKPLDIVNGPLMKGMDEVGRLFNQNKLIVAEVLQSAESMKAAVAHLEQFMDKKDTQNRGKIILATVKGDVHDIGKNLVEIILTNNGFEVVDLGIKVPPEQIISSIKKHNPDIVGLSGLLVKSAQQMVITAEDLSKAGIEVPILVGGAALSERFVNKKISAQYDGTVVYASDAMNGLDLSKTIVNPQLFAELKQKIKEKRELLNNNTTEANKIKKQPISYKRSSKVSTQEYIPKAPDYNRHLIKNTPIEHIWNYINPLMLYGRHLGIKGKTVRLLDQLKNNPNIKDKIPAKDLQIWEKVEEAKEEFKNTEVLHPSAVYQFFKAKSEKNTIHIIGESTESIEFPRQKKEDGLCLADYLHPTNEDNIALFAVTVGKGVRELANQLKNRGDYLKSHVLQVLALESAEGYAELLHDNLRKAWGFPDSPDMTMMQRFQAKYHGKRYSFGYPACPSLDDQKILFKLLKPQDVGIQLTEGCMMDPEASVSAVVFHHPDASYFSVGSTPGETEHDNRS